MKYLIFIILILSQALNLCAQTTFNRIYRLDSAQQLATSFYSLSVKNNKIYLAGSGNVKMDNGFITQGFMAQLSETGTLIKNNNYGRQLESTYFSNELMVLDKNSINLIGGNQDTSITFLKTDFNGDILIRKKLYPSTFPTSYYGNPASITKFNKGYALTTYIGYFTNRADQTAVIVLDTLGNKNNVFDFAVDSFNYAPAQIIVNKKNNLVFALQVTARKNSVDSDYIHISNFREIDSSGNTLWTYNTPSNRYIMCENIVQLANGNYLIWGSEELSTVPLRYRQVYDVGPYLAEINPSRGLVWERKFKTATGSRLNSLKILRDSGIVMSGGYYDGPFNSSAFIIRLNNRRDSIYRRNFKAPELATSSVVYYPNQIEELSNGDLLIAGYLLNNIPISQPKVGNWGWVVRTDSLGCSLEPSSCRVSTIEIDKRPLSINVFPNPAKEQVNFTVPTSFKIRKIDIYGIDGHLYRSINVEEEKIATDTNGMSGGLYIVKFMDEQGISKQITKLFINK